MFSQALVIVFTGGCLPQCMLGYTPLEHPPKEQTPPRSRHPPEQTPPRSRHPQEQTSPWEQTPPGADTPSRADTPREQTPPEQTPLRADTPWKQTTPGSRHPPEQTPPGSMLGNTVNARAVGILLECNLGFLSTYFHLPDQGGPVRFCQKFVIAKIHLPI